MTGKELKEFVSKVPDDATVEVRERPYGAWNDEFELQASLRVHCIAKAEVEKTNVSA